MGFLEWLELTGIGTFVREGDSIWAFPMVITLHTFGLTVLVGTSAVVNLRLLGVGQGVIPLPALRPLFRVMWSGFGLNLVTGVLLLMADATTRGSSLFFLMKMVFVATATSTLVLIKRSVFDAPAGTPSAGPSPRLLAVVSLGAWTAAITAGRLLAYL